jgi:hypothetical protein
MDKLAEVALAPIGTVLAARDTRIIERPGWYQVITPSSGSSVSNEVVLSVLGADAEQVVRRTIREYADAGVAFKWQVVPQTEPADLGAILERYGFTWIDIRGMAITTQGATLPAITVEPVTPATLREYYDAFARGWGPTGFSIADPDAWLADHARVIAAGTHAMYLARIAGQAAGTAGTCFKPRSGYLVGGNVVEEHRGRGVYRALVTARLHALAARGIPLAVTQARELTSAPMLEHMGFETVCRGRVYRLADPLAAVERFAL